MLALTRLSFDLILRHYEAFYSPKRATAEQAYSTVNLHLEATNRETTYGIVNVWYMAVQKLPEHWDKCVKNEQE